MHARHHCDDLPSDCHEFALSVQAVMHTVGWCEMTANVTWAGRESSHEW